MKIVVTGSEGVLGKPLVDELEKRGHDVWKIDLQHNAAEKYIRADVSEYRQILRAIEAIGEFDIMYHLAAEFGRINGEEYFEQVWKSNVIGTRNILEIQKDKKFKLIFASSSEVYGERKDKELYENVVNETYARLTNDYAISKWVNEQQILNFQDRHSSDIVRCRFFNVYGPGEKYNSYRSVIALFTHRAINDIPYTVYQNHHRDFIYIDDFINTFANVSENFKSGEVYNIGGLEYVSIKELSDSILSILDKNDDLVVYKTFDEHNVTNKMPNLEKAKNDLNHNPSTPLYEGLKKTIEWLKSDGE